MKRANVAVITVVGSSADWPSGDLSGVGRAVECGELYSLQCRGRCGRAWRRAAVCEVGVGKLCVVVGRRWRGGSDCSRCLLVAFTASRCDTRRSLSTSELGVLCRWRSILSRCVRRQSRWQAATVWSNGRTSYTVIGRWLILDSRTRFISSVIVTTQTSALQDSSTSVCGSIQQTHVIVQCCLGPFIICHVLLHGSLWVMSNLFLLLTVIPVCTSGVHIGIEIGSFI